MTAIPSACGRTWGEALTRAREVHALARLDAEILLGSVAGAARARLLTRPESPLEPTAMAAFEALAQRRAAGEPVAYLVGWREFWGLPLATSPAALVPRPETELLVERALQCMPAYGARVLDLGTGNGAIAFALATERPAWRITATDAAAPALALARRNRAQLGAYHAAVERVRLVAADWLQGFAGPFDLIVANPPYIAADDPHLCAPALRYEPQHALVAGADGLGALRRIAEGAPSRLRRGGALLLEHGADQGGAVTALLNAAGLVDIESHADLAGLPRAACGWRSESG